MSRLPELDLEELDPDQRRFLDHMVSGPRGGLRGPFVALVHVPELAMRVSHLGEFLRYETNLPQRLAKLAVIVVARELECGYALQAHTPAALSSGLAERVIEAIRTRIAPDFANDDERIVYEFTRELVGGHDVTDAAYASAEEQFGTPGVVELSTLIGYYGMVCTILNAHGLSTP